MWNLALPLPIAGLFAAALWLWRIESSQRLVWMALVAWLCIGAIWFVVDGLEDWKVRATLAAYSSAVGIFGVAWYALGTKPTSPLNSLKWDLMLAAVVGLITWVVIREASESIR